MTNIQLRAYPKPHCAPKVDPKIAVKVVAQIFAIAA